MDLLGNTSTISLLKNPFNKNKIESIWIRMGKNPFVECQYYWHANVEFKDGSTSGKQEFKIDGAENLHILLKQIEEFIKSL